MDHTVQATTRCSAWLSTLSPQQHLLFLVLPNNPGQHSLDPKQLTCSAQFKPLAPSGVEIPAQSFPRVDLGMQVIELELVKETLLFFSFFFLDKFSNHMSVNSDSLRKWRRKDFEKPSAQNKAV